MEVIFLAILCSMAAQTIFSCVICGEIKAVRNSPISSRAPNNSVANCIYSTLLPRH